MLHSLNHFTVFISMSCVQSLLFVSWCLYFYMFIHLYLLNWMKVLQAQSRFKVLVRLEFQFVFSIYSKCFFFFLSPSFQTLDFASKSFILPALPPSRGASRATRDETKKNREWKRERKNQNRWRRAVAPVCAPFSTTGILGLIIQMSMLLLENTRSWVEAVFIWCLQWNKSNNTA